MTLDLINLPAVDQEIFQNAARRWNQVIVSDVPDFRSSQIGQLPPYTGCKYPTIIDDLYICAIYQKIDGPGTILGSAAPIVQRTESPGYTVTGRMRFDFEDSDAIRKQGTLPSVILHEIGHILGIGTLWQKRGIQTKACAYTGIHANNGYEQITDTFTPNQINSKCICNRRLLSQHNSTNEMYEKAEEEDEQQRVFFLMNTTNDSNNNDKNSSSLQQQRNYHHRRLSDE
jgi:hypothetical protein